MNWFRFFCGVLLLLLPGCQCGTSGPGVLLFEGSLKGNSLVFKNVSAGKVVERQVWLVNTGGSPVSVTGIAVAGKSKSFSLAKKLVVPFELKTGYPYRIAITVRYQSSSPVDEDAVLRIAATGANNLSDGHFELPLQHRVEKVSLAWSCGSSLQFGNVAPGSVTLKTCTLKNLSTVGSTTAMRVVYKSEQGGEDAFQWRTPVMPVSIEPDSSWQATIAFVPPVSGKGKFSGTFQLLQADGASSAFPPLRVEGRISSRALALQTTPYFPCNSDSQCSARSSETTCREQGNGEKRCQGSDWNSSLLLEFPVVGKGRAIQRSFVLKSTGDNPVEVQKIALVGQDAKEFSLPGIKTPFVLAPDKTQSVVVRYHPTDDKGDRARVEITTNARAKPYVVNLQVDRKGCHLEVEPTHRAMKFSAAGQQKVLLTNKGNGVCRISKIDLQSGKRVPFDIEELTSTSFELKPGESEDFSIEYTPGTAAARDSLVIVSNDTDEPTIVISLEGGAPSGECKLSVQPAAVNYRTRVGESRTQKITFLNKGTAPCLMKSVYFESTRKTTSPHFQIRNASTFPMRLDTSKSVVVEVTFAPKTASSSISESLLMEFEGLKLQTFKVPITAIALEPCLIASPVALDFNSSKVACASLKKELWIRHSGAAHCPATIKLTSASITKGSQDFRMSNFANLPLFKNSGSGVTLFVNFKPSSTGTKRGTLEIFTDTAAHPKLLVQMEGEGVNSDKQTDVFSIPKNPKVDVLMVIDDSCSMADDQLRMSTNIVAFLAAAQQYKADYQIGVTTTDTTGARFKPGCFQGRKKIITNKTVTPAVNLALNVKVGDNGSGVEKGLDGMLYALSPQRLNDPQCNKGFLRNDARLAVLILSDEPDASRFTANYYVRYLWSLKPSRPHELTVASSIVGPPPLGCKSSLATAQGAPKYWDFGEKLGGLNQSFCGVTWKDMMSRVGEVLFGPRRLYYLTRAATPSTIVVKLNGTVLSNPGDYSYIAKTNSIRLAKKVNISGGSSLTVAYSVNCIP